MHTDTYVHTPHWRNSLCWLWHIGKFRSIERGSLPPPHPLSAPSRMLGGGVLEILGTTARKRGGGAVKRRYCIRHIQFQQQSELS